MADAWLIDTGDLRHRVAIYDPPSGLDAFGQDVSANPSMDGWTLSLSRWAKIESNLSNEYVQAQQVRNLGTHTITMRYCPTLLASQRIMFGSRIFNIKSIYSTEERNVDSVCQADEVLGAS